LVGSDTTTIRNLSAFKLQCQLILVSLELLRKQKVGDLGTRVVIRNVASKVAAGGARGTQVAINKP